MGIFGTKKKSIPTGKKQELKSLALKKVKSLERKNNKRFNDKYVEKAIKVYRIFLERRYSLPKGLTHEELSAKIKERKISRGLKTRIVYFSAQANTIEYSMNKVNGDDLAKLLEKLKTIIRAA